MGDTENSKDVGEILMQFSMSDNYYGAQEALPSSLDPAGYSYPDLPAPKIIPVVPTAGAPKTGSGTTTSSTLNESPSHVTAQYFPE